MFSLHVFAKTVLRISGSVFMRDTNLQCTCFCSVPSLLQNKVHPQDFANLCSFETAGKDAEEEEEEEEDQEEEEEEKEKVAQLHSPVTLSPDCVAFERYEQLRGGLRAAAGAPGGKRTRGRGARVQLGQAAISACSQTRP